MIKYHIKNEIVTMDLVDLEHCGFDHEAFCAELEMAGITEGSARWPVVLMVNFFGGHVVSGKVGKQILARMRVDGETFKQAVKAVLSKEEKE